MAVKLIPTEAKAPAVESISNARAVPTPWPLEANDVGRTYFVPEGQHDSSQARSAWESVPRKNRPVGYGMIGRS